MTAVDSQSLPRGQISHFLARSSDGQATSNGSRRRAGGDHVETVWRFLPAASMQVEGTWSAVLPAPICPIPKLIVQAGEIGGPACGRSLDRAVYLNANMRHSNRGQQVATRSMLGEWLTTRSRPPSPPMPAPSLCGFISGITEERLRVTQRRPQREAGQGSWRREVGLRRSARASGCVCRFGASGPTVL